MTQTLTAADAQTRFPEIAKHIAETGERVVVELDDDLQIVMVSAAELKQVPPRVARREDIRTRLAEIHEMVRRDLNGRPLEPDPVEVLRKIRDGEIE